MQNFEKGHYFPVNVKNFKLENSKIYWKIVSFFKILHVKELKISNLQQHLGLGFWVKTFAFLTVRFVNI